MRDQLHSQRAAMTFVDSMRYQILTSLAIAMIFSTTLSAAGPTTQYSGEAQAPDEPLSLWYRRGAEKWVEALAIGNGRLGGMIWGNPSQEKINLNEGTFWSAGPYDPNHDTIADWKRARQLIFEGKFAEA